MESHDPRHPSSTTRSLRERSNIFSLSWNINSFMLCIALRGCERWVVSHVNVPVQHSLQQHGFSQTEEWISKTTPWTSLLPKMKGMLPICHFSENSGRKYAHVILTAEADSLSTDAKHLLEDYGLVGCHSPKGNFMSVHARIDSTGYDRLLWESYDEEDKGSHAAIF